MCFADVSRLGRGPVLNDGAYLGGRVMGEAEHVLPLQGLTEAQSQRDKGHTGVPRTEGGEVIPCQTATDNAAVGYRFRSGRGRANSQVGN